MCCLKQLLFFAAFLGLTFAIPSAVDILKDMYRSCLQELSVSCVKPKALAWMSAVSNDPVVRITEDLHIVKKNNPEVEVNNKF